MDAADRTPPPAHGTRAEQRDATQAALLDATIESLAEAGWSGTTTRGVAKRAGVSQGAQQHYFPTKSALVDAAIARLADAMSAAVLLGDPVPVQDPRASVAELLDQVWALTHLPIAGIASEIALAARTDPSLVPSALHLAKVTDESAFSVARRLIPDLAGTPGAYDWLRTTIATIRGLSVVESIDGGDELIPDWTIAREHIMASFDAWFAASKNDPESKSDNKSNA